MRFLKVKVLLLIFVVSLSGCVATKPFVPVEETKVIAIGNVDQKDLYVRVRQWFSQYFVSGESVIDYEDPNSGTIIGNGFAVIGSDSLGIIEHRMRFNLKVDTKDGRFRATTKVIEHSNRDHNGIYDVNAVTPKREADASAYIEKMLANLQGYIANNSGGDNW